tara:strand:- start:952 stop:1419 length:468 start_codon:yes stop_codon:yes gene_type:complete
MIQIERAKSASAENIIYVNLYDSYLYDTDSIFFFSPLIELTSQETNKSITFIPTSLDLTYKQRYFKMTFFTAHQSASNVPLVGIIYVGYKDFPYGLYDVKIYKNNSSSNLDASGLQLSFMGLGNLLNTSPDNYAVDYTEYESTQQQQVYLTNTYV